MIFGGIWMLLFWGFVLSLIVWGIGKLTQRDKPVECGPTKDGPLDTAKQRYARGEISREEFEQIRRDLY
jgi:putative membrane protein